MQQLRGGGDKAGWIFYLPRLRIPYRGKGKCGKKRKKEGDEWPSPRVWVIRTKARINSGDEPGFYREDQAEGS